MFLKEEFTDTCMDEQTHDRHNCMTLARWPLASGAKNQENPERLKIQDSWIKSQTLYQSHGGEGVSLFHWYVINHPKTESLQSSPIFHDHEKEYFLKTLT